MEQALLFERQTPYTELEYVPSKKKGNLTKSWQVVTGLHRTSYSPINLIDCDIYLSFKHITPFAYIVDGDDYVKTQFEILKEKWISEIQYSSNPIEITSNKYYKEITDMRFAVVPYLLEDMKKNYTHWFKALRDITGGIDPIKKEHYGNVPAMVNDWLDWYKK